jgi:hypothetical protein
MQNRRVQIVNVNFVLDRVPAKLVRPAMDDSFIWFAKVTCRGPIDL